MVKIIIIGGNGLPHSVSDCIVGDVISVGDVKQFPKASVACNLLRMSAVNVQVSQAYIFTCYKLK